MTSPNTPQLQELNVLKFYGILLVVLGHVTAIYTPMSLIVPNIPSTTLITVKEWIYTFHMPMFIFVSGCVFAYQLEVKQKTMSFKSLFINKAKRLMIPFFVFGLFMVYPTMVLLGFRDPVHYLIDGFFLLIDPRHLWFVAALFLIFLLFFGLRQICLWLKLPVWTVTIIALILHLVPFHTIYFQIGNVEEYFLWFSVGYLFITQKQVVKYIIAAIALGWCVHAALPEITPTNILDIYKAITGIALFYILSIKTLNIQHTRLYQLIAPNSFGIYLFHAMIIYWLEYYASPYAIPPVVLTLCVFVTSIAISVALTIAVRRLGWGVVIGERSKS